MNEHLELSAYLDGEGRLRAMPVRLNKKIKVLSAMAGKIPADRTFTEKEFNELLGELHTFGDAALIRRELVNFGLVEREGNGRRYRLREERPSEEELLRQYCSM